MTRGSYGTIERTPRARCRPRTSRPASPTRTCASTSRPGPTSISAFRKRGHAALNALWLGIHFQDTALIAIVVPAVVLKLAPRDHTAVLAVLATLVGAAVALVPPLAGWLSDRARRRGGDRRRETAIALAVDVAAIAGMAFAMSTGAVAVALVAATIAITAAQTIYQALLPEVVPREAWGTSAGVRGAFTLVGTVLGLLAAALLSPQHALFAMVAAVSVAGVSLAAIPPPAPSAPPAPHAIVRDRHDLWVTVVARGWIVLGMTLLNTYVLYFFSDVLHVHDASLGTGMVAGAALLGAIVSSIGAGKLSDILDRRVIVALSGIPMTLAALGFALFPDLKLIFVYAALFGLGFGGVFAVGWALALDAIPEIGDVARDLGVWGTLSSLPAIAAPGIGAWIIAHGATTADGYRWLFGAAGTCFAIGSLVGAARRASPAVADRVAAARRADVRDPPAAVRAARARAAVGALTAQARADGADREPPARGRVGDRRRARVHARAVAPAVHRVLAADVRAGFLRAAHAVARAADARRERGRAVHRARDAAARERAVLAPAAQHRLHAARGARRSAARPHLP